MRILLSFLTMSGLAIGNCRLAAAQGQSHADPEISPWALIDASAHEIFARADKNHNDFLSKIEFGRARATLSGQVEAWGQQGLIGKPIKTKQKARGSQAPPAPVDVNVASERLARSNQVSRAEFVLFAHAVLTDADHNWRQLHVEQAAQRKADQRQRKELNAQRRAGYLRGRTVFGIPF